MDSTLRLHELGDPIEVSLSSDAGDCLASSGIVTAARTLIPGWWTVQAKSLVGVAEVAGIELWIKPKVDIARIVFMLGYARDPKGWGDQDVGLEQQQELMPALAHAFERQADRALQLGLLQGYKRIEDSLPVLRGRLREAEQLKRRFGLLMPLEVAFDDFTIDIPENQLLLSAARRLLAPAARARGGQAPARAARSEDVRRHRAGAWPWPPAVDAEPAQRPLPRRPAPG